MDKIYSKILRAEAEFKAGSMGLAENMVRAIISLIQPEKHVQYFVTNMTGETRCGTVAKHI